MKKNVFTFALALLTAASAWAYDFKAGDLYYNITDETARTVEVTYEYQWDFNNYSSLPGVVSIPETVSYNGTTYSVTSIGGLAFYYCSALTQVTIPNSVTSIGNRAFIGCGALTAVYYTGDVAGWCGITFESYDSNPLYYAQNLYIGNTLVTELAIPESVSEIKDYAFYGCSALTQVAIPNSVRSIGEGAFYECYALTQVTIPNSVTSIGNRAFIGCGALTAVYYTGDVAGWCGITFESYDSNPLYYAQNLYIGNTLVTELAIPESVSEIKDYAFYGCSALTQVAIPNSVRSIGEGAFYECSKLTQASIPNSVTSIGDGAFSGCSALTQVSIPNSVTSIEQQTFSGCSALTSVIIGNHVETIGYDAFSGCSSLDTITCLGSNPPAVSQSFETIDPKTCKLYVPKTALMDYIQAPVWGAFLNMEGIDVPTETYMLNLRIGQGGSISHNGNVYTANSNIEVQPEATTTLQIQANPGYEIGSVSFNGTDYTAQVSEDGTLTLPALTENATLQVSFTQQSYTVAYYVAGSNAYFFTTVNYGETFRCHTAATEGHTILSVTLNGTDITGQLGEDGLLEMTNITEDCTLIISTDGGQTSENTGIQQDATAFRAWQSNGEVFVEHTQDMTGVALYDVTGRLLHQMETNGYGVLRMAAPGKIHIVRATYADGTTASQKVM